MADTKTNSKNFLVSGSLIGEALAIDTVRKSVRAKLLAANKLPQFSPETIADIVNTFLTEEQKQEKKNGFHKI